MTRPRPAMPPVAINNSIADVLRTRGATVVDLAQFGHAGIRFTLTLADGRPAILIASQSRDSPDDPTEYLHASISTPTMPTYDDLILLHRAVFGRRRFAYQVFAPVDKHLNFHPTALHLWGRADGAPILPDFGRHGAI